MIQLWLRLFRVPNLPTAIGDAVAGGAVVAVGVCPAAVPAGVVRAVLAAGAAELLLYMGGLADNDLVDEEADRAAGSDRPLATGALSRRAVRTARLLCFAGAAAVGLAFRLGAGWWIAAAAVLASILAYDRVKERLPRLGFLLMGLCRGLAVASGAAAASAAIPPDSIRWFEASMSELDVVWIGFVVPMVVGWTLYTAAVTRLGACEERAAGPMGQRRYWPALFALVPVGLLLLGLFLLLLGFAATGVLRGGVPSLGPFLPLLGCLAAAATWCAAVWPLGEPHGPRERGRAVGRSIGGLLWMQTGFLCFWTHAVAPVPAFVALAAACWIARLAVRRAWPAVTGS